MSCARVDVAPAPWPFPPSPGRGEDLRRLVRSVLSEARFHHGTGIWQHIASWVGRALRWFFRLFAGPVSAAGHAGGPWAAAVVVLVLAALVVLVVRSALARGGVGRRRRGRAGPGVVVSEQGPPRPWREWMAEADRLAGSGHYRDAARCRYRGVVAALAERGTVQEVPGRTAGAYLRVVLQAEPGLGPAFSEVTSRFERSWYGQLPVAEADDRDLDGVARRVLAQVVPQGAP